MQNSIFAEKKECIPLPLLPSIYLPYSPVNSRCTARIRQLPERNVPRTEYISVMRLRADYELFLHCNLILTNKRRAMVCRVRATELPITPQDKRGVQPSLIFIKLSLLIHRWGSFVRTSRTASQNSRVI